MMFENIEFANPKLLWLLLIIPAAIVWYVLRHKKQEASVRFSDLNGFAKLPKTWKAYLRHLLFALKLAAMALLIVALARPQSASTNRKSNVEGIDIVLAMDVKARQGGGWQVYLNGGRVPTGMDAVEWAVEGVRRGAG